ncbi:hypothetical protein [Acidiphilium sp.]|uniref:hypothetical protein n=1 Tax=Acidiphilium sp. TaxID=527 RepID=UPI0025864E3F|nr:hypothetical protein [Acidiphilium sp.]
MIPLLAALLAVTLVAGGLGYAIGHRWAGRGYRQIAGPLLGLRDGEYALRAAPAPAPARGKRSEVFAVVNTLADGLMGNRRAGIESDALLGKLLGAVDLAIIVIGPRGTVVGGNEAAGALLAIDPELLGGTLPDRLGIGTWRDITAPTRFETALPGGAGPWEVRCVRFRRVIQCWWRATCRAPCVPRSGGSGAA